MLTTSRLILVPLTHEQLLLYKNDPVELARDLSLNYVDRLNDHSVLKDLREALEFWIRSTREHPLNFRWFTNWEIILRHERIAIGGTGFAGSPDMQGKAMIGYGLDIRYYGQGYASEAVDALIRWGFSHDQLRTITAETLVSNAPSQRVLLKNNFKETARMGELIYWERNK